MTPVYVLGRNLKIKFWWLVWIHSINGGTGGVIRATRLWILSFKVKSQNSLHAEILALLQDLITVAQSRNIKQLLVEINSQVLLNYMVIISAIYADCRSILLELKGSVMEHTPREANTIANLLPVYERKTKDPHMICNQPYVVFYASLSLVKYSLERDSMGNTSFRSVPLFYG